MPSFTRKAIIDSFLKLLEERPLSQITIRDIVEDCHVNRNTFYYHFADLPSLIEAVVKDDIDRIITQYAQIASLQECLDVAYEFVCSHRRAALHLYHSSNRDIFERYLMDTSVYVAKTYIETVFPDVYIWDSDRELIVHAYACECYGLAIAWLNESLRDEWRGSLQRFCELRTGTLEMMIRRSAEDKAKAAKQ